MIVKIDSFNNYVFRLSSAFGQNTQKQSIAQPEQGKAEEKLFFSKNKGILAAGSVALGGIVYVMKSGRGKSNIPKTHIERLNCFGKKIIEDLRLDDNGKLIEKQILHDGIKYSAKYSAGKLSDIEGYKPVRFEDFNDEKYLVLKDIIREFNSELVVSRSFGKSTKYWLFDKKGETVTQVNELNVDKKFLYQYGNCRLNKEKTVAYDIDETFSPNENIPFGEIFECYKKGLL